MQPHTRAYLSSESRPRQCSMVASARCQPAAINAARLFCAREWAGTAHAMTGVRGGTPNAERTRLSGPAHSSFDASVEATDASNGIGRAAASDTCTCMRTRTHTRPSVNRISGACTYLHSTAARPGIALRVPRPHCTRQTCGGSARRPVARLAALRHRPSARRRSASDHGAEQTGAAVLHERVAAAQRTRQRAVGSGGCGSDSKLSGVRWRGPDRWLPFAGLLAGHHGRHRCVKTHLRSPQGACTRREPTSHHRHVRGWSRGRWARQCRRVSISRRGEQ